MRIRPDVHRGCAFLPGMCGLRTFLFRMESDGGRQSICYRQRDGKVSELISGYMSN